MIIFITGASGVGKTTLIEYMKENNEDSRYAFYHFDSIGIPSGEEMAKYDNWQKQTTFEWIERLIESYTHDKVVFLEGSTSMTYIIEGFADNKFDNYKLALVDCLEEEMVSRLIHKRKQPELVSEDMKNWRRHLYKQAIDNDAIIIDTSSSSIMECADQLREIAEGYLNKH